MDIDSLEQAENMDADEIQRRLENTREILRKGGAHYVIDEVSELLDVVADVNERLAHGEKP